MIAEILSPTTRQNDLTYKRYLYASQGVGTYLIVDPATRHNEHLTLTCSGDYESTGASDRLLISVCGCELAIDSQGVFAG